MARENLTIRLAERPTDEIVPGTTFAPKREAAPSPDDLKDGEILVEVLYLSLDPSLRGQLNDRRSYVPPVQIGAVMNGASASRVLASKSKLVQPGEYVYAATGWQQYKILKAGTFEPASAYPGLQQPQDMLSAMGLTGVTAWYGVTQIGEPKAGETFVVSGAAGATGSVAGQIAKLKGARVVGIAGSDEKCKWLVDDLGFDAAVNYKAPDWRQKLKEATPNFIDVYYDNVGGEILDAALARAKEHARFVICGVISQYNSSSPAGIKNIHQVVTMRIKMQGFIIFDAQKQYAQARKELGTWLAEGKIKKNETIIKGGLEKAEQGLVDLFRGVNQGKLLVEVKNPNEAPSKL